MIGSVILGLLIIGAISFNVVKTDEDNHSNAIYLGGLSGVFAGLAFFIALSTYLHSFPLHSAYSIPSFVIALLEISVVSLIFGATGAYFLYFRGNQQKLLSWSMLKLPELSGGRAIQFLIVFIFILFFTIGPPLITYTLIWAGVYEKSYACGGMWNSPGLPSRVDIDAIEVPQSHKQIPDKPDYREWFPALTPRDRCEIFVNGIDVSNASIIQSQGLKDTIDPPGGLNDPYHRLTILKGPDFMGNSTNPSHITVDGILNGNRFHYYQDLPI
jgi:hypothetical protein